MQYCLLVALNLKFEIFLTFRFSEFLLLGFGIVLVVSKGRERHSDLEITDGGK